MVVPGQNSVLKAGLVLPSRLQRQAGYFDRGFNRQGLPRYLWSDCSGVFIDLVARNNSRAVRFEHNLASAVGTSMVAVIAPLVCARTRRFWCQQFSQRELIGSSGIAMNRANHHMCMWTATTVLPSSGWSQLSLREIWVSRRTKSEEFEVL